MADSFSPDYVNFISDAIQEIEMAREQIASLLSHDKRLKADAYKIDPVHYSDQTPKFIPVEKASLRDAINSYQLQLTDVDKERRPRRTFGIIQVSFETYDEVKKQADDHNKLIDQLKCWLSDRFTTSHGRSRHIHAAYPNIIIATLYRKIKVASESCYSIGYDWNNNQRVPTKMTLDQIRALVMSKGDVYEDGNMIQTAQEAGDQAVESIGAPPKGYELVLIKQSKVHPQQIYYHNTVNEKKPYRGREGIYRVTLKANNCLIVPHNASVKLKHQKPPNYTHKEKTNISSHYTPVRESLGIYLRKTVEK